MRTCQSRASGLVTLLALLVAPAAAKVSVQVDFGWEKVYKVGAWSPVYITAVDPQASPARLVQLEASLPYDRTHSLRVHKMWTIGPLPTTTIIYLPLNWHLEDTVLVVRDGESGRKLYEDTLEPRTANGPAFTSYESMNRGDLLLGVSGRSGVMKTIEGSLTWTSELLPGTVNDGSFKTRLRTGYLPPRLLPAGSIGYDGLDLLVLNAPDLGGGVRGISESQQQAMVEWIRAGGRLLLWAGDGAVAEQSVLGKALPCRVGATRTLELSEETRRMFGIEPRASQLTAQSLEPLPGSQRVPLLGGAGEMIKGRCGLGEIAVVSFDASQLAFAPAQADNDPTKRFWQGLLAKLLSDQLEGLWIAPERYVGSVSSVDGRRIQAMAMTVERLGNVPGVGSFDFTYIAVVLLGMMVVVGPVDWIVLRKLGKQPWTWVTMAGWIGLLTVGAIYIGALFKSGDLHYRTVRLVDQVDQTVVGAVDVAGIYSPRTQGYGLDGPADAWWRPAQVDAPSPWIRPMTPAELELGQDGRGQRPLEMVGSNGARVPTMTVNVWNLKFLESRLGDPAALKPMIEAKLKAEGSTGIVGTIRNTGDRPLSRIAILTSDGAALAEQVDAAGSVVPLASVPPGQAVAIRARPMRIVESRENEHRFPRFDGVNNPYLKGDVNPQLAGLLAGADLAADRAERIKVLMRQNRKLVCVLAEAEGIDPYFKLTQTGKLPAHEKHWLLIRVLVELQ